MLCYVILFYEWYYGICLKAYTAAEWASIWGGAVAMGINLISFVLKLYVYVA